MKHLISLTKAMILFGLYGSLFIPIADLIKPSDAFFSLITAIILCYAFYCFDKVEFTNFYATKPLSSQREESTKLHKSFNELK
jgi:hypothetical protein